MVVLCSFSVSFPSIFYTSLQQRKVLLFQVPNVMRLERKEGRISPLSRMLNETDRLPTHFPYHFLFKYQEVLPRLCSIANPLSSLFHTHPIASSYVSSRESALNCSHLSPWASGPCSGVSPSFEYFWLRRSAFHIYPLSQSCLNLLSVRTSSYRFFPPLVEYPIFCHHDPVCLYHSDTVIELPLP